MVQLNSCDFEEINIFGDKLSDEEIMRKIINSFGEDNAFYTLDVGDVIRKHIMWVERIPKVHPHFAVKCNPNPTVIKVLAVLGANFDCASKEEISAVMRFGVTGDRIIFANPIKVPSQIKYAKKVGVYKMTADSTPELLKIKQLFPEAKIVIRIRCDAASSGVNLGLKFGCDPGRETLELIVKCKELNLDLHGFSFHAGSPCGEPLAIGRGIKICKKLIKIAELHGFTDVKMIDIGGGIPGDNDLILDEYAGVINDALKDVDSSIRVISEPGRYYVSSAFKSAAHIYGKKMINDKEEKKFSYYINDGVFGSFKDELLKLSSRTPSLLTRSENLSEQKYLSVIWGPTSYPLDMVLADCLLPELEINDWLYWKNMGDYTICIGSNFCGNPIPKVYPVIRRSVWRSFRNHINKLQNANMKVTNVYDGKFFASRRNEKCRKLADKEDCKNAVVIA